MANKKDKTNIKDERIEDVTKYGEFIASFDQWMTQDRQREVAQHLEEVSEEVTPGNGKKKKINKKRSN